MLEVQVHRICAWCHQTIRRYTATEPVGVNERRVMRREPDQTIWWLVFGPFAKWFMESQKAKIMSVIRCFFPSLVFIVTSKTTQKNGRTEHLPVHPDAKNGGDFNRRIRFFSCAKEFRASSKSLINSCLSSGLPHFKTMGVVGLLKRRGTMWRVKMYVKQGTQPQKMGCWMRESENNAFLTATTAIHLHS